MLRAVLLVTFFSQMVSCNRYNVSYEVLDNCEEYDALSGYGYHTYFKIDDINKNRNNGDIINVKLYILAAKDAHILLSSTNVPTYSSDVYEIVLGAGGNTFAEIRRRRQTQPMKTIRTRKLLSAVDPVPIQLRVSLEGLIDISVPGSDILALSATDPSPFAIHYISFSSWGTTEAKFFYDCRLNDKKEEENMLNIVTPELTPNEQLRTSLFNKYDANTIPNGLENVFLNLDILKISYDYKDSFLSTHSIFKLNWTDPKMVWDPQNYSGIHGLRLVNSNIFDSASLWKPKLTLLNGKGSFFKDLTLDLTLTVYSTGLVTAESKRSIFETWCPATDPNWPYDVVKCDILIGLNNLTIVPVSTFGVNFKASLLRGQDEGEWHVIKSNLSQNSTFDLVFDDKSLSISQVACSVLLKRNTFFYDKVLYAPLIAADGLVIISLFAHGYLRASLNLMGILIIYIMFIFLAEHAPMAFVPQIVLYYDFTLLAALGTFALFIFNCWLRESTNNEQRFSGILRITKMPWLRFVLLMDGWELLDTNTEEETTNPSTDLGTFVDRLAFLLMVCSFIFIFLV